MCGIYGLLTSRAVPDTRTRGGLVADLRDAVDRLVSIEAAGAATAGDTSALEEASRGGQALAERGGFLEVIADAAAVEVLLASTHSLQGWIERLEKVAEAGELADQKAAEQLNRLIVGGRDLAWRLRHDIVGNLGPVREILGFRQEDAGGRGAAKGSETSPDTWAAGWTLNMVLNGLDRLEVRGRDSAGIAVFVHFPEAARLDAFVSGTPGLDAELERRSAVAALGDACLLRPQTSDRTLLFSFKVAEEVGEMGDNVRALRKRIASDTTFQAALRVPGIEIQTLAHTRWASNGVVSVANCHPVDSAVLRDAGKLDRSGAIVAVLNGDIDNYQDLCKKYVLDAGIELEEGITTDAKIIPVVVDHHYRRGEGDLEAAFRSAFSEFEGSMAIGVMAADRPGEFLFGQKGSGQGLYVGFTPTAKVIASEMYGVVELSSDYLKAEGERVEGGEIFRIRRGDESTEVMALMEDGSRHFPEARRRRAEITTRDINRAGYRRFLLKEISESVETVRKTLRGRFDSGDAGRVRFLLGDEVLDPAQLERFRNGEIRRILVIGQGTAAIAGDGVAALLRRALLDARHPVEISSMKATELSGHYLSANMRDALVIAVSQSGTTTDTNRTVDLARERGAWVIGIVNRRNSDLVYKSHGVLYTSDGRDIEMSVASTKAFYAQNVAGQILALALAQALDAISPAELRDEIDGLNRLPGAMERTLQQGDAIRRLAEEHASRKRYWALVGSGSGKIAADEIRIKLSELCYKSIATDFIEDKKHIDLSSEPLVLVCAAGARASLISDVVKEVAIFKAHQSVPIVIADEGERRFDPYAAGVIHIPSLDGSLGYLLTTMVGHLFGYHAACSFDAHADRLRKIRAGLVREFQKEGADSLSATFSEFADELIEWIRKSLDLLLEGSLDSCLSTPSAIRLATIFQVLLGRTPVDDLETRLGGLKPGETVFTALLRVLHEAIGELARPIDAIKHQAKTVTVGISRTETAAGLIREALERFRLDTASMTEGHRAFLAAFEPLVQRVEGTTLYRLSNLDRVGRPRKGTTICVARKAGCAAGMPSRCDEEQPLTGTKWGVAKSRELYLGRGQTDGRKILILPLLTDDPDGHLLLFHLELKRDAAPGDRLRALQAHRTRLEELRIAVTELSQEWDPGLLDLVDTEALFFAEPLEVARSLAGQTTGS